MSTTKAGRILGMKSSIRNVDFWDVHSVTSKLSVKYVTAQTLQDMQIEIIPIPFPPNAGNDISLALRSRPNILRKRSQNDKFEVTNSKIKTEGSDHVTGSTSEHVTGIDSNYLLSGLVEEDHGYSGTAGFIKEEVVYSSFNGDTIDLTLDDDELCNDDVIEITE